MTMKSWYQTPKLVTYLLAPLAGCYRCFALGKYHAYRRNWLPAKTFQVPIIVIGNLTVGGAGKTPLVIALAKALQKRGFKPGIVSRGYGAKNNNFPFLIDENTPVLQAGDEPLLIAQRTQLPVVIDPNRPRAVASLLANFAVDVVLADDGLQHYRLARTVEIVVVDGERRFGNGFCLPAGPLREPLSRLSRVNFIVANGQALASEQCMRLVPESICQLNPPFATLPADVKRVHAVAGIGHPERFFQALRLQGLNVIAHPFPDHHWFQPADFKFHEDLPIIMTEKDAVKCMKFQNNNLYVQKINAKIPNDFVAKLINLLK